jgi:hypothetical protein
MGNVTDTNFEKRSMQLAEVLKREVAECSRVEPQVIA